jgi:3-dehydroquinate synthase
MEKIVVDLGHRGYPIYVSSQLNNLGQVCREIIPLGRILIISDKLIFSLYGPRVKENLETAGFKVFSFLVPRGEQSKSLSQAARIWKECVRLKLERSDSTLALGGGVIGDLTGFVAATYLRGINFVLLPTTLLSHVDSSVGGKVGINLPQGQNLIGAFHQPRGVWINTSFLQSLQLKQIREGLAELVKHAIIKDESLFDYLERNLEMIKKPSLSLIEPAIARSVKIKARIVERDEREEKGIRQILNFGHTIGHALETSTDYRQYTHGEAVALGMIAAGSMATKMGTFSPQEFFRMRKLLQNIGLPVKIKKKLNIKEVEKIFWRDKKVKRGKINFVLPRRIGEVFLTDNVPTQLPKETLSEMLDEKQ